MKLDWLAYLLIPGIPANTDNVSGRGMGDEEGKDSLNLLTYPSLFLDRDFFFKPKDEHLNSESQRKASHNQSWCFKNVSTSSTHLNNCSKSDRLHDLMPMA